LSSSTVSSTVTVNFVPAATSSVSSSPSSSRMRLEVAPAASVSVSVHSAPDGSSVYDAVPPAAIDRVAPPAMSTAMPSR